MNHSIAKETLSRIFNFDRSISECIDRSASAYKITNLSEGVLSALGARLPSLTPIQAVLPEEAGERGSFHTNTTNSLSPEPYRSYQGSIANLMPGAETIGEVRLGFLRILLECKALLSDRGFCVSTKKVATQLSVSQQLISRYRRDFVLMGWLKPHKDRSFAPGKRAKRFTAAGALAAALKQLYPVQCNVTIPKSIPDNAWNKTLGSLVGRLFYTHSLEEILKEVRTIEGSEKGDRLKQTEFWYKWYAKKRSPLVKRGA